MGSIGSTTLHEVDSSLNLVVATSILPKASYASAGAPPLKGLSELQAGRLWLH